MKNLFVLTPLVFARELFDVHAGLRALLAFACFCGVSSAVYVVNDIADVESDRAHPIKSKRPIASGKVPVPVAKGIAVGLALTAILGAFLLAPPCGGTVLAYFLLNLAYTAKLKRVAYLDVLCIALGFELRVLSGAFAAAVPPSAYLLVVTFLLSTYLGFGKRMHELRSAGDTAKQRAVLKAYSDKVLTGLLGATALATIVTYAIYTLDPATRTQFRTDYLGLTTVFAVVGVLRFLHLVRNRPNSESPTEEMLRDAPFIANLLGWAIAVVGIIYFTRGT